VPFPSGLVITAAGLSTPFGGRAATWRALLAGRSAVGPSRRLAISARPCATAAECVPPDPAAWLPSPKQAKFVGRSTALLLDAGRQALLEAGWQGSAPPASDRVGVYVASGHTGLDAEEFFPALDAAWEGGGALDYAPLGGRAARLVDPYFALRTLANAGPAFLASLAGATGPSTNHVQGEAAAAAALIEAAFDLAEGRIDRAIVGAHDSLVTPSSYLSYERHALLAGGGEAARPRPFDASRDGTVLGEAAAVLLLEREDDARRRGAAALGQLAGVGLGPAGDEPSIDGWLAAGVEEAVRAAAGGPPGLVVAQALGTREGDASLAQALTRILDPEVPVTAFAGAIGHVGAATLLVELALATSGLADRLVPPVVGLEVIDRACGVAARSDAARLPASARLFALCLARSRTGQIAAVTIATTPDVDFVPVSGG
jgi:3-oxoacyl-[acyl-carrier-protein] synthase II